MATAKSKKTVTKKVAKKTADKKKPIKVSAAQARKAMKGANVIQPPKKRAYKRKPKVELNAPLPPSELMQAEAAGPNPNYVSEPKTLSLFDVNLLDVRGMPLAVKAMFLLELQSLGFVDIDLETPVDAGLLSPISLRAMEVVRLNQQNKILTFRKYKDLKTEDGVITIPTAYNAGVVVFDTEKRLATPESLEVDGVTYSKVL
ncbi:hypothetical protein HYP93_gp37 [Stenotrophomonas phage Pokken]|uniref:Uncharacterized protein n=1 Tax=Stenotrophomonas phage Pokken TaxID=2596674 RepID=A0A5B9NB34_9CAUD|nr:hypothetical protein HYP93_gp37 [Stenotrophomonas phage Pokken]QEG09260.1 hypothetical protein CPT_Pokken_037 [Stenotrophomonas phage Pokken]